jgi:3-deoxy-D-manno-octulosonic-acid transferase
MLKLSILFYTLGLRLYTLLIHLASIKSEKAKLWIEGRKNWKNQLIEVTKKFSGGKIVWVHCASLGEFEAVKPLIENFSLNKPETKFVISFFSPSGFEFAKNLPDNCQKLYLPIDSKSNARFWVNQLKPELAIFVKYEFWYFYFKTINKAQIPLYIVGAHFNEGQIFFKPWGVLHREMLKLVQIIFVQDDTSKNLIEKFDKTTVIKTGDPRFDRAFEIANQKFNEEKIEHFISEDDFVIVAGSTWPGDEKLISQWFNANHQIFNLKLIIAPHDISEPHLVKLEELFGHSVRFSREEKNHEKKVLIIDNIGMLSKLYRYGKIAFVGGGFGVGMHNIIEPAAYGMPVFYGPNFNKHPEAQWLIDAKGGFKYNSLSSLTNQINPLISKKELLKLHAEKAKNWVIQNCGSTNKILSKIDIKKAS